MAVQLNTNYRTSGHSRDAGRNVVHEVKLDGDVVGTRRSAHRYGYAICRWWRVRGESNLHVLRWSREKVGATMRYDPSWELPPPLTREQAVEMTTPLKER